MSLLPRRGKFLFLCLMVFALMSSAFSQTVVISQVYGGGGNSGATLKNDFIELHNNSGVTVNLAGWSVQYASATGSSWSVTSLSGTIQPGQYYLVQEAAGTGVAVSLPTPDASGTIPMSATAGKVALVSSTTALTGTCPSAVVDFVGFGSTANCFEGSGPTATLSNTTAALRGGSGCTDTNINAADFATGAPNPRNTAATFASCGTPTNPSGTGLATPASTVAGAGTTVLFRVTVTPGTSPTSSGLAVSGDLSSIGGGAAQSFYDDGTHGDVTANDNIFSFSQAVSVGTSAGSKPIPTTITDAQARTASVTISFAVTSPSSPPSGTGTAAPSTVAVGENTLLKVTVTPGTNPASTGIAVSGNLSSIGGSSSQPFYDDATHGDITAGDGIYSYQSTILTSTAPGAKSLAIAITDAQARSGAATIALTVLPAPPPTTVKISQVYGGGGNSGATYTRDFVEIFNLAATPIDITNWSVQYISAGTNSTWQVTPICPSGTCVIQPGHYYLVQEAAGNGGTTPLPAADVVGTIPMGGTAGKVALLTYSTPLVTSAGAPCPPAGSVVDLVGYGGASCSETSPTGTLSNTLAAVRRGNGCIDSDNNFNDFVSIGPLPRNNGSPANYCGGDPTQPSGFGIGTPSSLEPASNTLLTVKVTPATTPPSTGIAVKADLTAIGGAAAQPLYEDATHGDETAGDNTFSVVHTVPFSITTGAKSIVSTITDEEGRSVTAPITLTITSPTCGVERWTVKVGTDADANSVMLAPVKTTIADLIAIPAPGGGDAGIPINGRVAPTETTVWVVNAQMTLYKKEGDVDYHMVLQDDAGNTLIAEIPSPACIITSGTPRVQAPSPFSAGITDARETFDAKYAASPFFQSANVPVQVTGVGFFDFIHGQTGVAGNGIELHPVIAISFTDPTTTVLASTLNPSQYGQSVSISATVSNGGTPLPTGTVTFMDGAASLGSASLDGSGVATITTSALSVGSHSITAHYEGDNTSGTSTALVLAQEVNKADQTIDFGGLATKTYGDADFTVSATASSHLTVGFSIVSGPATIAGNSIHITGGGTVTVRASQGGDGSYNPAPDADQSFVVNPAGATITVHGYSGVYDASSHGATGSATGIHGEDLSGLLGLGASFTNVPGGTASWAFAGNADYAAASGTVNIVISKATATFGSLSSPVIAVGTASTSLSGTISTGALVPTGSVAITLHGVTQNAVIQAGGTFSSSFATGALAAVNPPYAISYAYAGDTNFNPANGAGTLTVYYNILPLYDPTKAAKSGSTIPLKIQLTNAAGANVSSASVVVTAIQIVAVSNSATSDVADSGNANPDNNFRYAGGFYIFNLSTKGLATGTYNLIFMIQGDPTQHTISFQVN